VSISVDMGIMCSEAVALTFVLMKKCGGRYMSRYDRMVFIYSRIL